MFSGGTTPSDGRPLALQCKIPVARSVDVRQIAGVPRLLGATARALVPACAALLLLGCSSDAGPAAVTAPPAAAPATEGPCAPGFAQDADGACMDTPAPESCPPGTRPRVGSATCEPVGWTSTCPTGTKRDASGFGCIDPAPSAACTGATREAYGAATCAPIGDCNAAFPPAGAIIVDGSFGDLELDATHVRTIAEGIAAATDGSTIAIETGTYAEAVTVAKRVTMVGRCAAQVEIQSPTGSVEPGIAVETTGVVVRGLTLTGHVDGIAVERAAQADIDSVVIRGARFAGLLVEGARATVRASKIEGTLPGPDGRGGYDVAAGDGAEASIDDTTIAGGIQGIFGASDGTRVALTRVVVTRQAPYPSSKMRPAGIAAVTGARVAVARSSIRDLDGDGGAVVEADGTVELTESIVRGIRMSGSAARGYGLIATLGGHLVARATMVSDIEGTSILARDQDSTLELSAVTLLGPVAKGPPALAPKSDGRGAGVTVQTKAKASLDGVAILGAWGFGMYVDAGASLDVRRSFVDGTRAPQGADPSKAFAVGLTVNAATATVSDVTISRSSQAGVTAGKKGRLRGDHLLVRDVIEGSVASSGSALTVGENADVDLDASVFDGATSSGVIVTEGGASAIRLSRSVVRGTRKGRDGYGHGVTVRVGARVVLEATSVVDNPGIGVAVDGARALLGGTSIARNGVGIHAQGGSFLVEGDDADVDSLGDGEVRVAPSTRFTSNATRVGSGEVPLPSPVLP